jgi:hypothetical protein
MVMNLSIYTYGYGDAMYYVLNGIAMIMNKPGFLMMIRTIAIISIMVSALVWSTNRSMGITDRPVVIRILALYFVINGLLTPKMRVKVEDRVTNNIEVVDNLPFLFVPVAWLESVGDTIAGALEQAIRPVGGSDGFEYRNYGLAFGAQMQRESKNWRIRSPEFSRNMHNFIDKCVKYTAAIGHKYTVNDLHNSPDVWGLVSKNAGGMTRVGLLVEGRYQNMKCHEAAKLIEERYFPAEYESLVGRYAKSLFARASSSEPSKRSYDAELAKKTFASNVEAVFSGFADTGNAKNIITQQMMLAAMSNQNSVSKYGLATARASQDTVWAITAELAQDTLPILFTLVKCMLYASVVLLAPMMLLPGGLRYYKTFLLAVCSVQLWPFFYAILNMFVEMYTSVSIFGLDNGIINYTTYSQVGRSADRIAAIAGSMQAMIPYIAYQAVAGSAGGLMHLSGQIMSQGAVATAAEEHVKGRVNINNVAIDTMQRATQTAFKTDFNRQLSAGSGVTAQLDGSQERITADGHIHYLTGAGLNLGSYTNKIDFRGEKLSSDQQALNEEQRYVSSKGMQLNDIQATQESLMESYITQLAKRVDSGEKINFSALGKDGLALEKAVNYELTHGDGYNYEKYQTNALKGDATAKLDAGSVIGNMFNKLPIPDKVAEYAGKLFTKTLPVDLSASVTGSLDLGSTNTQAINRNYISSEGDHWRNNKDSITEVAKNTDFNKSIGINQELTGTITSTAEKVKNLTSEIGVHHERAKNISNQIQQVESFGESFNIDGTHKVEERLKDMGLSSRAAHALIEDPTSATPQQRNQLNNAKREVANQLFGNLYGGQNRVPEAIRAQEQVLESGYEREVSNLRQKGEQELAAKKTAEQVALNNRASADGLDKDRIQRQLDSSQADLNRKHQKITQEVQSQTGKKLSQIKAKQNSQAMAVQEAERKRETTYFAGRKLPKK